MCQCYVLILADVFQTMRCIGFPYLMRAGEDTGAAAPLAVAGGSAGVLFYTRACVLHRGNCALSRAPPPVLLCVVEQLGWDNDREIAGDKYACVINTHVCCNVTTLAGMTAHVYCPQTPSNSARASWGNSHKHARIVGQRTHFVTPCTPAVNIHAHVFRAG